MGVEKLTNKKSKVALEYNPKLVKFAGLGLIIGAVVFFMINYAIGLRLTSLTSIAEASEGCLKNGGVVVIDGTLKYSILDIKYNCTIIPKGI